MNKILLISFFNSSNIGDQAIGKVLYDELKKSFAVTKMDITGKKIYADSESTQIENNILPVEKCRFYALKSIISLRKPNRLKYAKKQIDENDTIILAGGNMIMDTERFALYSYLCNKYVLYAKKKGKKVIVAFVGVGNIITHNQKILWKQVLEKSNFISVRDSLSAQRIIEELHIKNDVSICKDPVFCLESKNHCTSNKDKIAINVYLGAAKNDYEKKLLKDFYLYVINYLKKDYQIVLYASERNDFGGVCEIYDSLVSHENVDIKKIFCLADLLELYDSVKCNLATRMHSFIIPASQSIPSIVLSWDKKIDGVSKDIAWTDYVYDIGAAYENKDKICSQIQSFIEHNDMWISYLSSVKKENMKDFCEHTNIICDIVEEK